MRPTACFTRLEHLGYRAVRTTRWKYIQYTDLKGMDELYGLEKGPYETKNLIDHAPQALVETSAFTGLSLAAAGRPPH